MQHKCLKCGTEFDGNFCPECGEKWQEEKICPKCGAYLSGNAKFCDECGYSFVPKDPPQTSPPAPAPISAPIPPKKMEKPQRPQKPMKPIYRSIVPEDQREELMPEMVKHIKRKRTLAALLFFHLSMCATLAFLFWSYSNMYLIALGGIPLIIIAICFIIWSRKCNIRDWHPEKIYKYKRLTTTIIILSVTFFVTVSVSFFVFLFSSGGPYMNQYVFHYREEEWKSYLGRTYGSVSDREWFSPDGDRVKIGTDEETRIIYQAEKVNVDYSDSSQESAYRNIQGGFIIYKLEKDMDSLETIFSEYIRNDENVSKFSHDKWTYALTVEVYGAYGISISTDATNWTPVADYTNRNYNGRSLNILSSDYFLDTNGVLYIKIEDMGDGAQLKALFHQMCVVCELYPTIFEMVANGYQSSIPVSLGVSLLYLSIALIILFCQYHKTAKQRKALCIKLCGATSIKSSEISVKYEQERAVYAASMGEYRRQLAIYRENQRAWAVYRYQMSRYSKGKPYENVPRIRIWCSLHRVALSVTTVVLVAAITITCVVATRDTRFRADNLLKIGLGAEEASVTDVLGEPFDTDAVTWRYYSKNYVSIMEEIEELEKKSMDATSFEELEKMAEEADRLEEKLKTITYQVIVIRFSMENTVWEMSLDTGAVYGQTVQKQAESCEISPRVYHRGSDEEITYTVTYTDGSIWMGHLSAGQLPPKGAGMTVKWSNAWGSYSATMDIRDN